MCRGESVGLLSLWAGQSREKEAMSEFTVIIEQGPYGFDSRQGVDDFVHVWVSTNHGGAFTAAA